MKKLNSIKGITHLSKTEQKNISGAAIAPSGCYQQGSKCCRNFGSGNYFCDYGECIRGRFCAWY